MPSARSAAKTNHRGRRQLQRAALARLEREIEHESDRRDGLGGHGLLAASSALDDLVALAAKKRWGLTGFLGHVVDIE